MKKSLTGLLFLAALIMAPVPVMAGTSVHIGIGLPPIIIGGPPYLVEIPETDEVYAAPDVNVELFFWNGWWWRPHEGHWYRSHYYDHGWTHYNRVPGFYHHVDPGWRGYYRDHYWHGQHWDYHRVPGGRFQGGYHGGHQGGHRGH